MKTQLKTNKCPASLKTDTPERFFTKQIVSVVMSHLRHLEEER
jgi:hypothetical protein